MKLEAWKTARAMWREAPNTILEFEVGKTARAKRRRKNEIAKLENCPREAPKQIFKIRNLESCTREAPNKILKIEIEKTARAKR